MALVTKNQELADFENNNFKGIACFEDFLQHKVK
jgi:hypothetical protein